MAQDEEGKEAAEDVDTNDPPEEDDHHHDEPWVENIFKTNDEMPMHTPESVVQDLAEI